MKALFLDFETEPISDVPDGQFPKPVGMAIALGGRKPKYHAWGHPTGNNCDLHRARVALSTGMFEADTLVCHNIGFDAGVALQHMDLPLNHLAWHDTQVMAFHEDPHSPSLALKPLAERHLGIAPDEAEAVREWLIEHKIVRRNATRAWGAHICEAPGTLVAPYACGDILRTRALFKHWYLRHGRSEGYLRDIKATRVGLKMTQRGVLIDLVQLAFDTARAEQEVESAHQRLAKLFGMPSYDPEDKEAKADAIERLFGVDLPLTATGRRQVNKDALFDAVPPGEVKALLRYTSAINYDLKNYLRPWARAMAITGGRIHPNWSVTRSDDSGARTGRLASSPNFQNLRGEEGTQVMVADLQKMHQREYWTPAIRGLVVAPGGHTLVGRDWSQIELRLTAHYEDGPMAQHYRDDPDWDLHAWVMERVMTLFGVTLMRRVAKNIGFGSIYGAGIDPIVKQSRITHEEAAAFKRMYFEALPSLKELMDEVQYEAKVRPIKTLGGRFYIAEPPRWNHALGRNMDFYYKMLNYLIQGSAADLMKEAMIDADDYGVPLVLSVHDEPVSESSIADAADHLEALRVAMEHNDLIERITVPITSDGYITNRWSEAK